MSNNVRNTDLIYSKYLKYKTKYLRLSSNIGGAFDDEITATIAKVNLNYMGNSDYQLLFEEVKDNIIRSLQSSKEEKDNIIRSILLKEVKDNISRSILSSENEKNIIYNSLNSSKEGKNIMIGYLQLSNEGKNIISRSIIQSKEGIDILIMNLLSLEEGKDIIISSLLSSKEGKDIIIRSLPPSIKDIENIVAEFTDKEDDKMKSLYREYEDTKLFFIEMHTLTLLKKLGITFDKEKDVLPLLKKKLSEYKIPISTFIIHLETINIVELILPYYRIDVKKYEENAIDNLSIQIDKIIELYNNESKEKIIKALRARGAGLHTIINLPITMSA